MRQSAHPIGWVRAFKTPNYPSRSACIQAPQTARPATTVTTNETGVESGVGSRPLAGLTDRSTLTVAFSDALAGCARAKPAVLPVGGQTDLAVLLADAAHSISNPARLPDQLARFIPVVSVATARPVTDTH